MNWFLVGIVLLVLGAILIIKGGKTEKDKGTKSESLGQTGYLLLLFGIFAIVAQYLSIGDTMFLFVVITGVVILVNHLILKKRRIEGENEPGWVEFSRSFFPVLLLVFLIRGFLVEPYQIPSSSMRPGLLPGDFILVNKFSYGLRAPLTNKTLIPVGHPQHGDVMIFKYPNDTSINYIKRVIGLPGDTVSYRNKTLMVNGKKVPTTHLPEVYTYVGEDDHRTHSPSLYNQHYGEHNYQILEEPNYPPLFLANVGEFSDREYCQYDEIGFDCTVPKGHYFVMGDNRDHSGDSRYWGFVPEDYIVGEALLVWLNFGEFSRIGKMIK